MAIDPIDDYFEHSKDLFVEVFKDKPRLSAILKAYSAQSDELEAVFWAILATRDVDQAVGIQLDALGKIPVQVRVGDTDDIYRTFIKTRIRVNRSNGHNVDIVQLVQLATGSNNFEILDLYPASFVVTVKDAIASWLAPLLAEFLGDAAGAGIGTGLVWSDAAESGLFTFASGDDPDEDGDDGRGWSDDTGAQGGEFAGAF